MDVNDVGAAHAHGERGWVAFDAGHRTSGSEREVSISVMVASPRPLLLSAWLSRLAREPGLALHVEALTDAARLRASIARKPPQVLLLDKALLDRLDAPSLQALQGDFERTRVLLLWDDLCNGLVLDVLRHRFHGLMLTSHPPEMCLKAILAVSRGELWLSRAALAKALAQLLPPLVCANADRAPQPGRGECGHTLTPREQQIVDLLRRGCTNKEIANELGVMEDTVKKHLQSVFGKLGVHRRALVALRPQLTAGLS